MKRKRGNEEWKEKNKEWRRRPWPNEHSAKKWPAIWEKWENEEEERRT
jgi:hypothetical protein